MSLMRVALDQIDATRRYTRLVLGHVPRECWCRRPAGAPSHITWQVGHIALVEALHGLGTVCGAPLSPLVPDHYASLFAKGTRADADPAAYPSAAELIEVMGRIHERLMHDLAALPESVLDEPASHSTGLIHTRFDLLMWIARHEMLHVGQIGLIRRLLGMPPYR